MFYGFNLPKPTAKIYQKYVVDTGNYHVVKRLCSDPSYSNKSSLSKIVNLVLGLWALIFFGGNGHVLRI